SPELPAERPLFPSRFPDREAHNPETSMDRDQTTSSALAESPETLGYLNLWQIVRRRKWRVLLGVFTCLILGTAYLVLSGPQYESTAAVLVLKKRLETAPISGPNQDPRQLEDYLATHMQVIT